MIKLEQTVVVEGRYDKSKLSSIIDAHIVVLDGFRIYKDREKMAMLRRLAMDKGLIIFTDSDHAGFQIRNYLKSSIPKGKITHVYIPDILGKESRKDKPSSAGTLGVEGVPKDIILEALSRAGLQGIATETTEKTQLITKQDFMEDGLSGGDNSSHLRQLLLKKVNLPKAMSTNAMLGALNAVITYEKYKEIVAELKSQEQ